MLRRFLAVLVAVGAVGAPAARGAPAAAAVFVAPTKTDKCPVCGMFVARYQDWVAEIVFEDGGYLVFDGAKDLFRFSADPAHFLPSARGRKARATFVTDYYSLEPIDGAAAFYVLGSDVYGPMGKELIPFQKRSDAEGFFADHHGTRLLEIREIPDALPRLQD